MRTISASAIADTIARLCVQANTQLPADVATALERCRQAEPWRSEERRVGKECM